MLGFSEARILNQELTIPGATTRDYRALAEQLSEDIMYNRVPHYRVIGIKVHSVQSEDVDVTTQLRDTDKCYMELIRNSNKLVFAEAYDNESTASLTAMLQSAGNNREVTEEGPIVALGSVNTSDECAFKHVNGMAQAESLIKGVNVINMGANVVLKMYIMRGIGEIDYDSAHHFLEGVSGDTYIPTRASFSLNDILFVKPYELGDEYIYLHYKEDINESVLEKIIRRYGGA